MRNRAWIVAGFSMVLGLIAPVAPGQAGSAQTTGTPGAGALETPQGLPPAEQVFEKYIEAIGGEEKVHSIKNRRIVGTFLGEPFEFKANLRIWWESDGRFHQNVSEPAGLRYNIFANKPYTWVQVQDREPRFLGGMQRIELLDTADFYGEANYKNRYTEYKTVGKGKVLDQEVYVVKAVAKSGRPHMLYFNIETGLLVGTRAPTMNKDGKAREMVVRLGDYKPFGGVLYPTRLEQQFVGSKETTRYQYNEIEVNVDDSHDYTPPAVVIEQYKQALANDAAKEAGGG